MQRPSLWGGVGTVLGLTGIFLASIGAEEARKAESADRPAAARPRAAGRGEPAAAAGMAKAARAFLAALSPEQRPRAALAFEGEERFDWHFVPRARKGLPFKEMDSRQRELAHAFLRAGLSQAGYQKATTIISLEDILRELEGGRGPTRDPELYYFTVFGQPSDRGTWGWRIEGHHLSLNFTVIQGRLIASTPQFLGANPAEVKQGPRQGLRALRAEEDLARELLKALDSTQRAEAVIATNAPRDIITGNSRKADIGEPKGVPYARMNRKQQGLLVALLDEYARTMPEAVARERLRRLREAKLDQIHFAWAGGAERGQPHYYRLQGPTFLVEYDNTQNQANHIHSVWRDFDGDWGLDLLRHHYETAHAGHGH